MSNIAEKLWLEKLKLEYEKQMAGNLGGMMQANWPPTTYDPNEGRVRMGSAPATLHPADIIQRILGCDNRFRVQVTREVWGDTHPEILHVALLDINTKQIVRFEEAPERFPSDALIDKLRLLR